MKSAIKQNRILISFLIKNLVLIILVSIVLVQSGCKKFVEIDAPPNKLVESNVFKSSNTATAALLNIYAQMYNNSESYFMEMQTGLLGDELTSYAGFNLEYYTNSMSAITTNTFGPWNNAYNYIYQANAIIEGLENNNAIALAIQKQLTGEAKFIRAFWHFYLTNCYGDVPLVLTTDYNVNASLSRTPKADVYKQIIKDLQDAQGLLNENFVDAKDTSKTTDRVRPTKWAATALLSRAYLYMGDYSNAESQATMVINNSLFHLVTDLNSVFLANSAEAIWQLPIPLPNSYNTPDGYYFILQGEPNTQAISSQLMDAFETDDQRKVDWINSYTTTVSPIITYNYPFKYKVYNDPAISEYVMMLRLSEQYLIRAEARAHGAGTGLNDAVSDLNVIRNRAGLTDYNGTIDQASVLKAILHERQVELFGEWGHRWFDLVRTDNANSVLGAPGNVCQDKGGTWSSNWQLFPIPQTERNINRKLTQNQGY